MEMIQEVTIKRGDVFFADLSPVKGSEQGGQRPVVIVQNNVGNKHSPTVIVAAITAKIAKAKLPTHVEVKASQIGLVKDSVILLEQVRTIDKTRLIQKLGQLDEATMALVNQALVISLGLVDEEA